MDRLFYLGFANLGLGLATTRLGFERAILGRTFNHKVLKVFLRVASSRLKYKAGLRGLLFKSEGTSSSQEYKGEIHHSRSTLTTRKAKEQISGTLNISLNIGLDSPVKSDTYRFID